MVSAMSRVRGTDQTMRGRFTNWGALLQPGLLLLGHATTYQARKILRTKVGQLLNTFKLKPSIPNMMDKEQRKRRCWLRLEWTKCYHCCLSFGKGNALLMLKCVHCVNFVETLLIIALAILPHRFSRRHWDEKVLESGIALLEEVLDLCKHVHTHVCWDSAGKVFYVYHVINWNADGWRRLSFIPEECG